MKKALLVGINYNGSNSQLNGCINDVNNIEVFLLNNGYKQENITILTDETDVKPTRFNIIVELVKLIVSGADNLYFHYSGHGSYVIDEDGDEADGKDETLVPLDYKENGLIIDDEIRGLLQCVNSNQTLFCILDCCHSGSGMVLRYNLYERLSGDYLVMIRDRLTDRKNKRIRGKCIMLSGCMDSQTSADAYIAASSEGSASVYTYQGAMTNSFLQAITISNTYNDLVVNIRKILKKNSYDQLPNLSSSFNLDLGSIVRI